MTTRIQDEVGQLWLEVNHSASCCGALTSVTQRLELRIDSIHVAVNSVDARIQKTISSVSMRLEKIDSDRDVLWMRLNTTNGWLQTMQENQNRSTDKLTQQLHNVTKEFRLSEKTLYNAVDEIYENVTTKHAEYIQKFSNLSQSLFETNARLDDLKNETTNGATQVEGKLTSLWRGLNSSLRCCDNLSVAMDTQAQQVNRTLLLLRDADVQLKRSLVELNSSLNRDVIAKVRTLEKSGDISNARLDEFNVTFGEKTAHMASSLNEVFSQANETERSFGAFKDAATIALNKINSTVYSLGEEAASLSSALRDVNSSLLSQLHNSSNVAPGPSGPAGFNGSRGPPGPQGSGNFSLCRYGSDQLKTASNNPSGWEIDLKEAAGKRIVGVTCSTEGGAEYQLSSFTFQGQRKYRCKCAGDSKIFGKLPDDKLGCTIHYWECPLTTL